MLGKEVVEFSSKGLDQLKSDVKELDKDIRNTEKSNKRFQNALNNGTWNREVQNIRKARTELAGLRKEQERLQSMARRSALQSQYGRIGGAAMYYGMGAAGRLRGIGGALSGVGGGIMAGAATLGAPLAVGALASRGFSGTAAAAKLDMQFERLSRHVATDLLPIIERFSGLLNKINNARDASRAGTATTTQKGYDFASKAVLYGGTALVANKLLGGVLGRLAGGALSGAGSMANGAGGGLLTNLGANPMGTVGKAGTAGAIAYLAYKNYSVRNRAGDINEATYNRGLGNVSIDEQNENRDLIDKTRGERDPVKRRRDLQARINALTKQDRYLTDKHRDSGIFSEIFGSSSRDAERQREINRRLNVAQGLMSEMNGGKGLDGNASRALLNVQGAGERRGSSDLYEELASAMPRTATSESNADGETSMDAAARYLGYIWDKISQLPIG